MELIDPKPVVGGLRLELANGRRVVVEAEIPCITSETPAGGCRGLKRCSRWAPQRASRSVSELQICPLASMVGGKIRDVLECDPPVVIFSSSPARCFIISNLHDALH